MSESLTRTCATCGETKTLLQFGRNIEAPGRQTQCTLCVAADKAVRLKAANEKRKLARMVAHRVKIDGAARRKAVKVEAKVKARARKEVLKAKAAAGAKEQLDARRVVRARTRQVNVAKRELALRKLAQIHLLPFVLRMESEYLPGWVHKDICLRLEKFEQDIVKKKSPRLMLQMPPRAGKSQIASVNFPAWYLGRNPAHEIISATYSGSLALGFSRKVRGVMREPTYKNVFPGAALDKDNQNAEGWQTTKGGMYTPAGVGGPITGKGAHCLIIDDPVKNSEEAESATTRESIKNWYGSTAYTRLAPGGGLLVIQTRWHDDDLSGWLENQMNNGDGDHWDIVRYPAVAMVDEKYRKEGEALHPERYDLKALRRIQKAVGPRTWDALYQQHPVAEDGTYFTKDMIHYYTGSPPLRMHHYTAWDLAIGKAERNDYTAGITAGLDMEDNIWVLDLRRGRWDSHQIVEEILDVHSKYKSMVTGIERGQLSLAIGPYLDQRVRETRAYDLALKDLAPGRRDKESRARAIQGRMTQKKVFFPKDAPFMAELRDEMLKFPLGQHDDQCVIEGTLVETLHGPVPIENIKVGDLVVTPFGLKAVTAAACTNEDAEVIRVGPVTCTANHPLYVQGRGFVRADSVQPQDELATIDALEYEGYLLCRSKQSSIKEQPTGGTQNQRTQHTGNTSGQQQAGSPCTEPFGKLSVATYLTGIISTIKTATVATTAWITSRASLLKSTPASTLRNEALPGEALNNLLTLKRSASRLKSGTEASRAESGTPDTVKKHGLAGLLPQKYAGHAKNPMKLISQSARVFVHQLVHTANMSGLTRRLKECTRKPLSQTPQNANGAELHTNQHERLYDTCVVPVAGLRNTARVYNLTVEGAHMYFTNGVLSHNCDALAYIGLLLQEMTPPAELSAPDPAARGWRKQLRTQLTINGGKRHMRA